jgi:hypothetical protein
MFVGLGLENIIIRGNVESFAGSIYSRLGMPGMVARFADAIGETR